MMNQNVMRDPLRAGMEARAHGLPKLRWAWRRCSCFLRWK